MQQRPLPERPERIDALVALALGVGGCVMAWLTTAGGVVFFDSPLWQQWIGSLLLAAPLVWRRRAPIAMMLVQTAIYAGAAYLTGIDLFASQIMLFLGFYSVGAWSPRRNAALWSRGLVCFAMAAWLVAAVLLNVGYGSQSTAAVSATSLAALFALNTALNIAFFAGAWVFGDRAWQQALEQQQLVDATEEIRALQDELVDKALESERMRIARELHDVVAHHVTAMSVQSAAARRMLHTDTEQAADALKQVELSAREAVRDLRTMVLTLRANGTDDDTLPTLADLEALVEAARAQGLDAHLERIGEEPATSPVVELALYRVAQEALTNASKHAGVGARVAVRLRNSADAVELDVSDDGRASKLAVPGTGAGLVGMRERLSAIGGTLSAGPKERGGFLVRARVPKEVGA